MPRGGKRPGAGRKKGSAHRKTREVADRAASEGVTPLEVMLHAMREHYEAKRYDEAAAVAKDAAPYIHPRLGALQLQTDATVRVIEDDGWYGNSAHGTNSGDDAHPVPAEGAAPSGAGPD